MRRFDKNKNMQKANQLAEQRYLESKGLINEGHVDAEGNLHFDDEPTSNEFFEGGLESVNMGLKIVFGHLIERYYNKITVGEVPEATEYNSDDIDEYAKAVNNLVAGDNRIPTGVAGELIANAIQYYLDNAKKTKGKIPLVDPQMQYEFLTNLLQKLR